MFFGGTRITPDHYAICETEIANTQHIKSRILDISYSGTSPAQKLDIYLPEEKNGPFPVIVSIHGGAFMGGDKADTQVLPMLEALNRGYAVISINYRLSWQAFFPALVHDVKAAVRWIRANGRKYNLDPDRIAAWGSSAGAYVTSMAGVSADVTELDDLELGNAEQSCRIQAAVVWYGPTNFLKMDGQLKQSGLYPGEDQSHNEADSPESLLLGIKITEAEELVRKVNPETYINPSIPPFLLQHGTMDRVVPMQQSIEFAQKLEKAIGKENVALDLLEGAGHADIAFGTPQNVKRVLDFLDMHLKK